MEKTRNKQNASKYIGAAVVKNKEIEADVNMWFVYTKVKFKLKRTKKGE